jgi:hypothetical protein
MVRRLGGDRAVVFGLLVLFAGLAYFITAQTSSGPEARPRRTTYSAKPGGLKAAYLLLQRRGIDVRRCERPPSNWPKDAGVIITATSYLPLTMDGAGWDSASASKATRWVEDGGTLIALIDEEGALTDRLGLQATERPTHNSDDATTLAPQQPAGLLGGVAGVRLPTLLRWERSPAAAVSLFGDRKPAIVAFTRGRGRVFAIASPAVIENHTLAAADNAAFFVQMVEASLAPGKRVYFDEYHQGYREDDTLWSAIGKPGRFAFLQGMLLAVLVAYSAGKRFGLPRPLPPPPRVSSEYVTSLSDLYRRANARDAALEGVFEPFWRDLCRASGLPDGAPADEVARRAAALAGEESAGWRDRIGALVAECREKIAEGARAIRNDDLLRLTREMEAVRKELRLGGDAR